MTKRTRTRVNRATKLRRSQSKLDRKMVAYAVAAGATVAAGGTASAVLQSNYVGQTVYNNLLPVDIDNNGAFDLAFFHSFGPINGQVPGGVGTEVNGEVGGIAGAGALAGPYGIIGAYEGTYDNKTIGYGSVLQSSTYINSDQDTQKLTLLASYNGTGVSSPFDPTGGNVQTNSILGYGGQWFGQSGFLGVKFDIDGNIHAGFVELSVNDLDPAGQELAIRVGRTFWNDEAFTDTHVEAIPEPVGLGVLALGAAGVAALGRRRRAK